MSAGAGGPGVLAGARRVLTGAQPAAGRYGRHRGVSGPWHLVMCWPSGRYQAGFTCSRCGRWPGTGTGCFRWCASWISIKRSSRRPGRCRDWRISGLGVAPRRGIPRGPGGRSWAGLACAWPRFHRSRLRGRRAVDRAFKHRTTEDAKVGAHGLWLAILGALSHEARGPSRGTPGSRAVAHLQTRSRHACLPR